MAKNKKLKIIKGEVVLIITLGLLAFFAYSILYTGGVIVKRTNTTEVVSKLKVIKIKGGEFELTQKDVDELSNLYFAKPISKDELTVQGVNLEMLNDELLIQAPINYNNLDLLLTSKGKINFSNGEISYVAENFKIGKVKLPKSLVKSQIKKQNNKFFYVEDNLIKIKASAIPIVLLDFKIVDNKILGVAEKPDIKELIEDFSKVGIEAIDKQLAELEQKIQGAMVIMNESQKEKMKQIQTTLDEVKNKSIEEKKKAISDIISNIKTISN